MGEVKPTYRAIYHGRLIAGLGPELGAMVRQRQAIFRLSRKWPVFETSLCDAHTMECKDEHSHVLPIYSSVRPCKISTFYGAMAEQCIVKVGQFLLQN